MEEDFIREQIVELRKMLNGARGALTKSKISPKDYFVNLSHQAPQLKFPELGISRLVVNICELVSTLLLEDTDERKSVSKVIVMMFEYYFLVAPILFESQGAKLDNDMIFMKHFMAYIESLCKARPQAQKELGNLLASLKIYKPIKKNIRS